MFFDKKVKEKVESYSKTLSVDTTDLYPVCLRPAKLGSQKYMDLLVLKSFTEIVKNAVSKTGVTGKYQCNDRALLR